MSDNYWTDDSSEETPLVKKLRAEIEKRQKELNEAKEENSKLTGQVRKQSVAEILKDLGVPGKISAFVPEGLEPTKENVAKWVDDYKDVFNLTVEAPAAQTKQVEETQEQEQGIDPATKAAWGRIQTADAAAGVTSPDAEAQTLAALQAAADASGGDPEKYFAILQNGRSA